MSLLFLNTKTGGLDKYETSLLSLGMAVWHDFKIENVLEIYVKEPVLRVTPDTLAINKIDLRKFNQIAIPVNEAWKKIKQFIYQNFGLPSNEFKIAGIDPLFSVGFLEQYFGKKHINKWFTYKTVDIQSIITFLYNRGILTEDYISNEKIYKYFNINNGVIEHQALKDCLNEIKIYELLMKLDLKSKKSPINCHGMSKSVRKHVKKSM